MEVATLKSDPFPILEDTPAGQATAAGVLARDRKATAEFVAAHADAVYAYVRRRLFPNTALVEDMVQDVFIDALRGLPRYRGEAPLRHWLLAIARHKVQDYYRGRVLEVPLEDDGQLPSAEATIDGWLEEERICAKVKEILSQLPEAYRCLLLWRYWEKAPSAEMAARLQKTEKSVERMLARAREQFRRRWEDE